MHQYATDSNERAYVPVVIALTSVVMALLLHRGLLALDLTIPWWVDAPSVLGFYGMLYYMFDRRIWRLGVLRKLGVIGVPDLNGAWQGYIVTSFDNQASKYAADVRIRQNWSRMSISLKGERSKSCSVMAMMLTQNRDAIELTYEYQSEPTHRAASTMHTHRGMARLTLSLDRTTLEGEYYTGRDRLTTGGMRLTRPL